GRGELEVARGHLSTTMELIDHPNSRCILFQINRRMSRVSLAGRTFWRCDIRVSDVPTNVQLVESAAKLKRSNRNPTRQVRVPSHLRSWSPEFYLRCVHRHLHQPCTLPVIDLFRSHQYFWEGMNVIHDPVTSAITARALARIERAYSPEHLIVNAEGLIHS